MKRFICMLSVIIIFLLVFNSCAKKKYSPHFQGPYLGQKPPGNKPQLFLPGLVSTNYIDHCTAFIKAGRVCVFSIWEKGTFFMYEKDGLWTQPQKVPWQNEQGATDFTAGPDDFTIYFQSGRLTGPDDEKRESNTWSVTWKEEGWAEPEPLPEPANTSEYWEGYPSVDSSGTVYFFTWARPDSRDGDIYRSRFIEGSGYLAAERLPEPINSDYYEVDPIVSPDGSYVLFGSGRPGGYSNQLDLYVTFRKDDGSWSSAFNAGPALNPFCIPTRMTLTPDGRYFFFPSRQETSLSKGEKVESQRVEQWGDYDIYWISTDFILALKEQNLNKQSAAGKIRQEYLNSGINSAAALLKSINTQEKSEYYFELSEFLSFCGELLALDNCDHADHFYETMISFFHEKARIMLGYSLTCLMHSRTKHGLELMQALWSEFPELRSEEMYIVTMQLRYRKQKEAELELLRFVTDEFPESHIVFYYLAEAYSNYGNKKQAILNCRKALELKPDFEIADALLKKLE